MSPGRPGPSARLPIGETRMLSRCFSFGLSLALFTLASPVYSQDALYVSSQDNGTVYSISPKGSVAPFITGLSSPSALTFDRQDNLFVANINIVITPNGITKFPLISKIRPDGTISTFAHTNGQGLAFGPSGDLFETLNTVPLGTGAIGDIAPNGTVSVLYRNAGLNSPFGLAFDRSGNLYVSNEGNNTISKITPNGQVSTFVSANEGLSNPRGLAFDKNGNLYVANYFGGISKVTPTGVVSTFTNDVSYTSGLVFDPQGNLYASNQIFGTISKIAPDGTVALFANGFHEPIGLAFAPAAVPEPSTLLLLLGLSLSGSAFAWRRLCPARPVDFTAGFSPEKDTLRAPLCVSRLVLCVCIEYVFVLLLGETAEKRSYVAGSSVRSSGN